MGMAGRASPPCRSIRRFDTTDPCETFGQPWRHHPLSLRLVLLRLYCLKQPIEGPCYRRLVLLGFTRRRLWGIRLARLFGAPSTHRSRRLRFQSFEIGGDGGSRLRVGRVVLPEIAFEPENSCGLGHALWRFMTARAVGRVKLSGGLSLLQASLRPGRARDQFFGVVFREPDAVT